MRGRLSPIQMENAYIRSMVNHMNSKDESFSDIISDEVSVSVTSPKLLNAVNSTDYFPTQKQKPSQQPKKQVRRRLHTSKPYQERLLNMAEARREIVTALKFHRASMKQQEATTNSYWSISTNTPPPPPPPPPTLPPPPLPPPCYYDNENFVLPTQTLGLNLNFKNFSNLDTNLYHKPISIYSTSSTSSTPSSSSSAALHVPVGIPNSSDGLHHHHHHHAMDDGEIDEIRSLGEQHQIEWNDTMNLLTSAQWCSFLKTMEMEAEEGDDYDGFHQFDQDMKFPQWLINSNESSCLQQHFDDDFPDQYYQDPALPCMDIGEIEAMDGEWLA